MSTITVVLLALGLAAVGALGATVAFALASATGSRRATVTPERITELERTVLSAHDTLLATHRELVETERARAAAELDGKKGLIDQRVEAMDSALRGVAEQLRTLDAGTRQAFGSLDQAIREQQRVVTHLADATFDVQRLLSDSRARGAWGERMAADVLAAAGFLEGVNYTAQTTIETGGRPDYTFVIPPGRRLHMDVKFPLDNYLRMLDAEPGSDAEQHERSFVADVKAHVKALAKREYATARETDLDFVLLFIPNEGLFAWLHQHQRELVDASLAQGIVLCSPLTLFGVLSVVRKATDAFNLAEATDEILELVGRFEQQWGKYKEAFDKVGAAIETAGKHYEAARSTRTNQLEKPLAQLAALRRQRGLDEETPPLRAVEG